MSESLNQREPNWDEYEEIDGMRFFDLLKAPSTDVSGYRIMLEETFAVDVREITIKNKIVNCIFEGSQLIFNDLSPLENRQYSSNLEFVNCKFLNEISIKWCYFSSLKFQNIFDVPKLTIHSCLFSTAFKIEEFICSEGELIFFKNSFKNEIRIDKLTHSKGNFKFEENEIACKELNKSVIINSVFDGIKFRTNDFGDYFLFLNSTITNVSENRFNIFDNCRFGVSCRFMQLDFGEQTQFINTIFQSVELTIKDGSLTFDNCTFEGSTNFSGGSNKLEIKYSRFIGYGDFSDFQADNLKIIKTFFDKPAFFDDIKIKSIQDCDRHTLRVIKQQLQKSENRIDYNKFRVHELNAYKREGKDIEWYEKIILELHELVSEHGINWFRALLFTLVSGIFFYSLFYITYGNCLECEGKSFFPGVFRFFMVTDFRDPMGEGGMYIQTRRSWILFILGRIFITFGIYEMIQSFRKFRA